MTPQRNLLLLSNRLARKGDRRVPETVSHNIHHVFSIADRLIVLSRGKKIADLKISETIEEEVSTMIMND